MNERTPNRPPNDAARDSFDFRPRRVFNSSSSTSDMDCARRTRLARAARLLACLTLVLLASASAGGRAFADESGTAAGTTLSNRAEATYRDADGTEFGTVSETVSVEVRAVSAVVVTPDETEPSDSVAPRERVARLFRVCNAGNTPDFYTVTRAEVSAPATLAGLFYDTDASGTHTDGDRPASVGTGLSPRLARGACVGLLAVVETNTTAAGSRLVIGVTARSNVQGGANGVAEDDGTIINAVGNGALFSSPDDARLPPVKQVEGRERVNAAPGQALTYTVAFRNSGDIAARNAVLRDELPEGIEYVAGSLRLNNRNLTDARDTDEGHVEGRRIEIRWASVAVGELAQVVFQARVRAGLAAGAGLVNTATVTAENSPAANSSDAVAVVNPFGLVYEGRSSGTATVAGARVTLLQDQSGGNALTLPRDAAPAPNEKNENPYLTDVQGRWSLALAPEQIGTAQAPARYFLNVTAQGFRARMIEVTVKPQAGAAGLFGLGLRAADGQPLAPGGSFELTEGDVTIQNLAAFAFNVPMFENQAVEISKTADRQSVEVGDAVSYRVEVHNTTAITLENVVVRDTLPASFHYAAGTARVEIAPEPSRPIEPVQSGSELVFEAGALKAGARALVTYRVRVGVNAGDGEQANTAIAEGHFPSGERVKTSPARASVRVRRGVFSTQQILLGRVFEDANANGQFDDGERAMPGVRLYLNNGQSVITDPAGLYNFPSVNDGALVVALDPVTLPAGYALADTGTRDAQSWTRLLRTPLAGGALLRQNFALRSTTKNGGDSGARGLDSGSLFGGGAGNKWQDSTSPSGGASSQRQNEGEGATPVEHNASVASNRDAKRAVSATPDREASTPRPTSDSTLASGTYEMEATEPVEPLAAGALRVLSPSHEEVVGGAALEVQARVAEGWSVRLEVEGERVPESRVGVRREDRKNHVTTLTFVGVNLRPGPNRIRATAVSPAGAAGESTELTAYGRGPAKRLEIITDKNQLSAGGRDSTVVRVRAFDQWGHPAADSSVALTASAGRLLAPEEKGGAAPRANEGGANANVSAGEDVLNEAGAGAGESQKIIQLENGEGVLTLVADNRTGATQLRATTGELEARASVRVTPETRPAILVGLAEVSVGKAAPEMSLRGEDGNWQSRIGFFYRGSFLADSVITLAYDSARGLNRMAGRDRLFQLDPLERAYPLLGDSSTRYEDAQSNSKLYARIDRDRSYVMFGDFETEHKELALAGYGRKLTGVKAHLENSEGDFVSVTGARPDTAFARDVFPGGGLSLLRLSHTDVLPGSEVLVLEVRDRRNPERVISREPLSRSIDYNIDAAGGEIFLLRHVSAFDYALNLVQLVATYEHRADAMSSAVYTGRASKTFKRAGLRLGASVVDQRQADMGSFVLGGIDGEKKMPRGGQLQFEYAMSRGQAAFSGNLFGGDAGDTKHNGSAYRAELEQPLPYREGVVRAGFARAGEGFLNPFGATVTPGSQRAHVSAEIKVRASSALSFGLMDERNRTANVNNRRLTGSVMWSERWSDRVRTTFGYDFRRYRDETGGTGLDSNLITVGAEWQVTDKLQLAVKREQNLGEADPTYPNQTTLSASYQYNQWTRAFLTQRLASAPIVPISDAGPTGFGATGARRETAIGVETRLWRNTSLNSRYQIENGINGADSFAVIGLQNRLPLSERLALELGYERGFHLAGSGESYNSATLGLSYTPTDNFRASGRYELRDRLGLGTMLTLGAAGRLSDNLTALARYQSSRSRFQDRRSSSATGLAALAWRPLGHDRFGLLFSYTYRGLLQEGFNTAGGSTRDRADVLSADGFYQLTKELELYGRLALKYGDNTTPEQPGVSTFTYMTQGRAAYRFGRFVDVAAEARMLAQPASGTRRTSYGAELGFWVLPDLRVGGGYNLTSAREPAGTLLNPGRRGFYFVMSSKLSRIFDLFGDSNDASGRGAGAGDRQQQQATTPERKEE